MHPHQLQSSRRVPLAWVLLAVALTLLSAAYFFSGQTPASLAAIGAQDGLSSAVYAPLSRDLRLYRTAVTDAGLADNSEEQGYAAQAINLADQVVDLSFTVALQTVAAMPIAATAATAADEQAADRIRSDQQAVIDDQAEAAELERELHSGEKGQAAIQSYLEVCQAQLALDQARLADARNDAARGGSGNGLARLQQMQRQHAMQTAGAKNGAAPQASALAAEAEARNPHRANGLVAQLRSAWLLNAKLGLLQQAQFQAQAATTSTIDEHNRMETTLRQHSADLTHSQVTAAARVAGLHQLADLQQRISRLDQQADTDSALAETYGQWLPVVSSQRRLALHESAGNLLYLLALLGVVLALVAMIGHFTAHPRWDRKRAATLRHILSLMVEITAALGGLMVLFGEPTQMLTVIGLCGAGLTVAFQDAILSAAGWFVLMGRHGVRLGDWVEINGVTGEVIEIRLLKTVVLETGNWISAGHPTGRKVFFPNSYALKGAYFNFSTSGQWLWDEMEFPIPAGTEPHRAVECVTRAMAAAAGTGAETAQSEWKGVSSQLAFSTAPTVLLRPVGANFSIVVRYTTPAQERAATRERLEAAAIAALEAGVPPPAPSTAAASA